MKRRDVLRRIGVGTGALTVSGVAGASGSSRQRNEFPLLEDISVEVLSGSDRQSVVSQVKEDVELQAIVRELRSRGWKPEWSDATAQRTTKAGNGSYDSLVLTFKRDSGSSEIKQQAVVGWIGNESLDIDVPTRTFGHVIEQDPSADDGFLGGASGASLVVESESDSLDSIEGLSPGRRVRSTVSGGAVVEREMELNDDQITRDKIVPCGEAAYLPDCGGGGGGGNSCAVDVCVVEHSLSDWDCAVRLIVSVVGVSLSCPLCPISGVSCAACLAAGGGFLWLMSEGCLDDPYECDMDAQYVSEGWIEDWTDGEADCDTYSISNDNAIVVGSEDDIGE